MTHIAKCKRPEFYDDKIVLAPMVRTNSLPFRLLCLQYGADLVYTEELIDHRLSKCQRLENKVLKTIDYVDEQGEIVLRTHSSERDFLILQLGSNNPERALKAAQLVKQDIAGIDFNFGCPKVFSIAGGMGAALLEKPQEIQSLLTKCVENLDIPVTCKIRILPELNRTLELVKMIENCGVSAIAVHGRTKEQRSRNENHDNVLREISKVLDIPMIANGGSNRIKNYSDILKFKENTNAESVMIARCAMRNPSIFKCDNQLEPIESVIGEFIKLSVRYDNYISTTKYVVQTMMSMGHFNEEFVRKFQAANDLKDLCDLFQLSEWFKLNRITQDKSEYYDSKQGIDEKLQKLIKDKQDSLVSIGIKEFICETIPFNARIYGNSPKAQVNDYINRLHLDDDKKPKFEAFRLEGQKKNQFYCYVTYDGAFYMNKAHSNSKRNAEHATCLLVCEKLGLSNLDEYKSRTSACNRNIA